MKLNVTFMSNRTSDVEPLRRFMLFIFTFGALGTGIELLLLEHVEDSWQIVPLALLGLSVVGVVSIALTPGSWSVRAFRILMGALVASGAVGVYLHFQANAEFELEMYPSLGGAELIWESLRGAIPALAPAAMSLLGFLGMALTYRHPRAQGELK